MQISMGATKQHSTGGHIPVYKNARVPRPLARLTIKRRKALRHFFRLEAYLEGCFDRLTMDGIRLNSPLRTLKILCHEQQVLHCSRWSATLRARRVVDVRTHLYACLHAALICQTRCTLVKHFRRRHSIVKSQSVIGSRAHRVCEDHVKKC